MFQRCNGSTRSVFYRPRGGIERKRDREGVISVTVLVEGFLSVVGDGLPGLCCDAYQRCRRPRAANSGVCFRRLPRPGSV
jgi:hypothetical protein